jgi:hypothetical protein
MNDEIYSEKAKLLIESIETSIPKADFIIFILGPSPDKFYYTVRRKLRDELRKAGFINTFFPEEIIDEMGIGGAVQLEDLILKHKADMIIDLLTLPEAIGSFGEAVKYSAEKETKSKLVVFMEEKYAHGFLEFWKTGDIPSYIAGWLTELSIKNLVAYPFEELKKCNECKDSYIVKRAINMCKVEALLKKGILKGPIPIMS